MNVPYFDLKEQYAGIRDEVLPVLDAVCRNASFILGDAVVQFEKEFAAYCEAKHCVALNSGTSALHLALLAAGVGAGHQVITTSNTFIATAEAISYTGASPVFVDIDPATGNIDPQRIEAAITRATRAIIPVHLYGRPAELHPILKIADAHHLPVIEDACQAHGARYRGKRVGSIGRAAAFSFYPGKNLGAYGEGGALTTNDDSIAEFARAMRDHGQVSRYHHDYVGYNYRMDGFQGAVLGVKLRHLEKWTARRRELAALYRRLLSDARVGMPKDNPQDESVYHLFVVWVEKRDDVRAALKSSGVETAVHYARPIHLQKAYASMGHRPGSFPHTERACEQAISMPLFPELSDAQVEYAAQSLAQITGTR